MYSEYPAVTRARRRHPVRRLFIALIVLAGLLVAADRIALVVSERAAAVTIQDYEHLSSRPSVSVRGFPFLTQLLARNVGQVTVRARDVVLAGTQHPIPITSIVVVLHHVRVDRTLSTVTAQTADAAATISYPDLSRALGVTVSYAGSSGGVGRVQAHSSVTVLGVTVSGTVTAGVSFSADTLRFVDPSVNGVNLPSAAVPLLSQMFNASLSLAGLPFRGTVRAVAATPAGLVVALSGADLHYTRSS